MWKLLSAKAGLTDEDLAKAIQLAEEETKNPKIAQLCSQCGRSVQDNHSACIYCGAPVSVRMDIF